MTEWGEKVTPENAWSEYPRPQFVRERWMNLNGLWDYAIAPKIAPQPAKFDGQILVPFAVESALSGVGRSFTPQDRLWYRRQVTLPNHWADHRILLHFGAVDFECVLWVNGGLVGSHVGGSDPFTFDVTAFLKQGENELLLAVTDPTDSEEQPRGKQQLNQRGIWYTPVSGIWQTVWMEPVPQEHYLAEIRLTPDVAGKRLIVAPLLNTAVERDDLAVRFTSFANGKPTGSTVVRVNREGVLHLSDLQLWSPESPFLYDLTAELVQVKAPVENRTQPKNRSKLPSFGEPERAAYAKLEPIGKPMDVVKSYFGMRNVTLGAGPKSQQPHLRFNETPIFQHGPLDQGWWPDGLLTPPSDEAMVWEIKWLKEAGFNMLRKHIKVEPARYYYHCDRLGILVWQDMPTGFNKAQRNYREDQGEPLRLSTSREQFELELRRMIGRLYNHPSIVMWVIHNEGWGQYESPALSRWVKSIDSSRWINGVSGWLDQNTSDIYDIHTYQEVPLAPANQMDRAIVIGEYGGVGWPVTGHLWDAEKRNWGYQTYQSKEEYEAALRKKIEALLPMRHDLGLSAAVYTQTTDVEGEVNGFMTYDRKMIKVTPATLKEMNRKLIQPR
ncbi:MAG: glycoside hydrolase family 2 [Verrucomicrobia bacterium]|nr:glycoside hydrolase family 2 [Verrucomicrobiota bacterium]